VTDLGSILRFRLTLAADVPLGRVPDIPSTLVTGPVYNVVRAHRYERVGLGMGDVYNSPQVIGYRAGRQNGRPVHLKLILGRGR
jgi:hypothetical protein